MPEINPYEAPLTTTVVEASAPPLTTRRLWIGYLFAPLVAPVLAAVVVVVVALASYNSQDVGTPIGIIALPIMMLTVGVLISYVTALVFGMPIIFWLHRKRRLNGWTIHLAAAAATLLFSLVMAFLGLMSDGNVTLSEVLFSIVGSFLFVTPFALLSGTLFWWITCRKRSV